MRAMALAMVFVLPLGGCATPRLKSACGESKSYNRRDLPPEQGLFTGPDGVWTIYRNDADEPEPEGAAGDCEGGEDRSRGER